MVSVAFCFMGYSLDMCPWNLAIDHTPVALQGLTCTRIQFLDYNITEELYVHNLIFKYIS